MEIWPFPKGEEPFGWAKIAAVISGFLLEVLVCGCRFFLHVFPEKKYKKEYSGAQNKKVSGRESSTCLSLEHGGENVGLGCEDKHFEKQRNLKFTTLLI